MLSGLEHLDAVLRAIVAALPIVGGVLLLAVATTAALNPVCTRTVRVWRRWRTDRAVRATARRGVAQIERYLDDVRRLA